MNTKRMVARRLEYEGMNDEAPPRVDQVHIAHGGNDVPVLPLDMTNGKITESLLALDRAITTHVNKGFKPMVNVLESTMSSRLREFVMMNPPIFLSITEEEDPQDFVDSVYNVLSDTPQKFHDLY